MFERAPVLGVVAFACSTGLSFDEWVNVSGQVRSSSILLWSFRDVLNPEVLPRTSTAAVLM